MAHLTARWLTLPQLSGAWDCKRTYEELQVGKKGGQVPVEAMLTRQCRYLRPSPGDQSPTEWIFQSNPR
jgi:hypothetical protein